MANLTITLPDEMKALMDAQTEVNWSEVCRTAISVYLDNRKNIQPRLSVRVDRTSFNYYPTISIPQLSIQLGIKNLMGRESTLDRIVFQTTLSSAKTGEMLALLEEVYLNKHTFAQDAELGVNCIHNVGYITMETLWRKMKGSFNTQTTFWIFVDGIKQPLSASASGVIPIDQWNESFEKYQKDMNRAK